MRLSGLAAAVVLVPGVAGAAERAYTVVPAERSVVIEVGKSGLFGFAGHEHEVVAPAFSGEVVADPDDPGRSRVTLVFDARGLKVTDKGESADDLAKVQESMLSPKVLDAARFPEIRFESKAVKGQAGGAPAYAVEVTGDLTLHGVTRPVTLPLKVELSGHRLVATGQTRLRQTDFGMKPVSVGGVVNVKDELKLTFRIEAEAR
jgi:polyisoprenoid-binding protein YceI